jgi:hypothetical protein
VRSPSTPISGALRALAIFGIVNTFADVVEDIRNDPCPDKRSGVSRASARVLETLLMVGPAEPFGDATIPPGGLYAAQRAADAYKQQQRQAEQQARASAAESGMRTVNHFSF